jgi:uncharacterized membrane protein
MKKIFTYLFLFAVLLFPSISYAQDSVLLQDEVSVVKAQVVEVINQTTEIIPGVSIAREVQTIKVEIIEGDKKGRIVEFENDYIILKQAEIFYVRVTKHGDDGRITYMVQEPYRLNTLLVLGIVFIILVIIFGGIQGLRGLASLVGSLILIMYILLPGILAGYSPILVSVGVSALIIVVGSYITHGFNKTTSSAVIGMIITVIVTGILAYVVVYSAKLTGFSSDEAIYLNFDTSGSIDFLGLLMGGIMIGLLGVLYDVAIGQAISVEELHRIAPHIQKITIYKRAIRIGREHIGALVNTLAIAYVGVSLPLLLLYVHSSNSSIGQILNSEIFATEIIRTIIGSIGLVLAVPITTLVAVFVLMKKTTIEVTEREIKQEREALEHVSHHH